MNVESLIYTYPEKWMHIRKIARLLKISPNTVRKNIALLKKRGLIVEKTEGQLRMVRANIEGEDYKISKRTHNLQIIYASGIVKRLRDKYNPQAIILFGSYSRGEDISTSDIDLGIIADQKHIIDIDVFEKKLLRKIQLSIFKRKEVSQEFFNNIINGIVLWGMIKNE